MKQWLYDRWASLTAPKALIGGGVLLALVIVLAVFREQLIDRLVSFWQSLTWLQILIGLGLFLGSLLISFVAIGIVMVKIPANYFSSHYKQDFLPNSSWAVRWGAVILKNILGLFLIALGILLSVPGVPGQGILTILLGLIMIDIPGKRPLEAKIIKRPTVLAAVNNLRGRYNKPPLELD
jgi:hypothetical protein